jgi:hypothetical protein
MPQCTNKQTIKIREYLCVMRSTRIAFEPHDEKEKFTVYHLRNSEIKKWIVLSLIVIPESLVLISLYIVGYGFILTTDSVGQTVINSVAIAFIMDIDNFSVEAFQMEHVSERANNALWETHMDVEEGKFTDGVPKGFDLEVLATFNNVKKVVLVILISGLAVGLSRLTYCYGWHAPPGATGGITDDA